MSEPKNKLQKNENIPFVDLSVIHDPIREEIDLAIKQVIDTSDFILGDQLRDFEEKFAKYCQSKYCLGVGNGGDALRLALMALGIKKGDEVITVANTFTATVDAIIHVGATPVLIDCDEYFNIDVSQVEKSITSKTKAIIVVHLYGQMANIEEIMRISKKHNLYVIEDAAQAHGAEFKGKKAGSFGDIGCFSFYPTKNLGAFGDGGAIVTNNKEVLEQIKMLRNNGMSKKYYEDIIGFNSRLDSIQASILNVKLKYLDHWNQQRIKTAHFYNKLLEGVVEIPKEISVGSHIYHLYVIKVEDKTTRDSLREYINERGISTLLHYPIPVHLQKAYGFLKHKTGDFPQTEHNAKTIISLPMFPGITKQEIRKVVDSIKSFS